MHMYKDVDKYFTTFIGSSTQPGLCGIIMEAVIPEVSDFCISPYPPGLQKEKRKEETIQALTVTSTVRRQTALVKTSVDTCLTFSRVAMRSMAKVTRCITVMDMSSRTMADLR